MVFLHQIPTSSPKTGIPRIHDDRCLVYFKKPTRPNYRAGGDVISVVGTLLSNFPDIITTKRNLLEWNNNRLYKPPDMSRISLVVGTGPDATSLHDQILLLTKDHEVHSSRLEECLNMCNSHTYLLIWIVMSVPSGTEVLSMTSSIRYSSKCNKGTVIIGVTNNTATGDLRLHGIDELVMKPVLHNDIREKYSKWTSVQLIPQDDVDSVDFDDKGLSEPSTPVTPLTPLTPATPATPRTPASVSDETDRSSFSLSIDSGIESPSPVSQITPVTLQTFSALRSFTPVNQPIRNKQNSTTDHTTKEKLRRERIKDSCDQLRVLLPYIRGRKTDMASILEMCVEYLKIVNAALPQDLQSQIVEILTKDTVTSSPQGVRNSVKKLKREQMAAKVPQNTFNPALIDKERCEISAQMKVENYLSDHRPVVDTEKKRECSKPDLEFKLHKRMRVHGPPAETFNSLRASPSGSAPVGGMSQVQSLPSLMPSKQDSQSLEQGSPFLHVPTPTSLYGEVDNSRMFSGHVFQDSYPSTPSPYFNSPVTKQQSSVIDRDPYGVYLDTHSVYQYYGNVGNYSLGPFSDYVNPNSVLSMSDTMKYKSDSLKHSDHDSLSFPIHPTPTSSEDLSSAKK